MSIIEHSPKRDTEPRIFYPHFGKPSGEYWYRFHDSDLYDSPMPYVQALPVVRRTNCCVVVDDYGKERHVLMTARKRYCYPTIELARESYVIRKRRQRGYARATIDFCNAALEALGCST